MDQRLQSYRGILSHADHFTLSQALENAMGSDLERNNSSNFLLSLANLFRKRSSNGRLSPAPKKPKGKKTKNQIPMSSQWPMFQCPKTSAHLPTHTAHK